MNGMHGSVPPGWGLCVECRWWQVEPRGIATHQTAGRCTHEELQALLLRVTGNSGCNRFQPGPTQRSEGAGQKPPQVSETGSDV